MNKGSRAILPWFFVSVSVFVFLVVVVFKDIRLLQVKIYE